jgi:hypothetical protein
MSFRSIVAFAVWVFFFLFFLGGGGEGSRSRSYGRTAALRLILQHCDEAEEKDYHFLFTFRSNEAPVE